MSGSRSFNGSFKTVFRGIRQHRVPFFNEVMVIAYFAPYIDATGLHLPTYEDRLEDLVSAYRSIFGAEAELSPEVPDYQLLSVFARALDDASALAVSLYNSRNPAYASGGALDLLLPQYGLTREAGESAASARGRMFLALIPGVTHVLIRVNSGDEALGGIPAHTVAAYVNNGNAGKIAEAIFRKKPPGIGTWGSLIRQVDDGRGNKVPISFSRPTLVVVYGTATVRAYDGFDEAAVKEAMSSALTDYFNRELEIGEAVTVPRLYGLLYQAAGNYASSFAITDLYFSGISGMEREKLVPDWNAKLVLNGFTLTVNA